MIVRRTAVPLTCTEFTKCRKSFLPQGDVRFSPLSEHRVPRLPENVTLIGTITNAESCSRIVSANSCEGTGGGGTVSRLFGLAIPPALLGRRRTSARWTQIPWYRAGE